MPEQPLLEERVGRDGVVSRGEPPPEQPEPPGSSPWEVQEWEVLVTMSASKIVDPEK